MKRKGTIPCRQCANAKCSSCFEPASQFDAESGFYADNAEKCPKECRALGTRANHEWLQSGGNTVIFIMKIKSLKKLPVHFE